MAENERASEQKTAAETAEFTRVSDVPVARTRKKRSVSAKKKRTKKVSKRSNGPIFLSADEILAKKDLREEELVIDEWEGSVVVRALSSVAHEQLVQSSMEGPMGARQFNMIGYLAKLSVICRYDGFEKDGGKRIFQDGHTPMLMKKASGPVSKIATKAQELSGLGGVALERLRSNLGLTPSADSLIG